MEESKAAAYYDELTRKGEGAARFKQGLGFSSSSSSSSSKPPPASSSSFLSSFVRAGERNDKSEETERPRSERERGFSGAGSTGEVDRREQLNSIRNKLSRKPSKDSRDRDSREERGRERERDRESDRDRDRDRGRDRSRERERGRDRDRDRRRDRYDRDRDASRDRKRDRYERSRSPSRRERERSRDKEDRNKESSKSRKVDYADLIPGYERMTAAEKVKTKMKLQLSETAAKDPTKGMAKGWERFDFDKDAPLDDDEEIEAADDDESLMNNIGKSFRFSAVEAKREDQIRRAHDEAMFGGPTLSETHAELTDSSINREKSYENLDEDKGGISNDTSSLVNEKIFATQQGSWRDRIRKSRDDAK